MFAIEDEIDELHRRLEAALEEGNEDEAEEIHKQIDALMEDL